MGSTILFDGLAYRSGLFGVRFGQNGIFGFAFHKSGDDPSMSIANDEIAFPVADSGLIVNDSRAFINTDTVGNASPAILFAVTFAVFFLATQVMMKITALSFILVNMEVNAFVTDRNALFFKQTA